MFDGFLSWPLAGVLIAAVFLFLQRRPTERLIDRIRGGKVGSAGFEAPTEQTAAPPTNPADASISAELPKPTTPRGLPPPDDLFMPIERGIRKTIDENFDDPEVRYAWALRSAAMSITERIHESNYRQIFGSQITLLRALNAQASMTTEQARPFYAAAAATLPAFYETYSFERWLVWLSVAGLIEAVPGEPPTIRILPAGRDFLLYLTKARLSDQRPG